MYFTQLFSVFVKTALLRCFACFRTKPKSYMDTYTWIYNVYVDEYCVKTFRGFNAFIFGSGNEVRDHSIGVMFKTRPDKQ